MQEGGIVSRGDSSEEVVSVGVVTGVVSCCVGTLQPTNKQENSRERARILKAFIFAHSFQKVSFARGRYNLL
jgi:hypothetical protein